VRWGAVEPKIATVGTPRDEARCAAPESLPTNPSHSESSAISSPILVWPAAIIAPHVTAAAIASHPATSPAPPTSTDWTPRCASKETSAA
jgi:hypothetical protein